MNAMTGTALEPYDPDKYARDEKRVEEGFWTKLRKTPLQVKAILAGALAYFIMPADLVPDFIAVVGFGDDAAVLAAAIRSVLPYIKDDHRNKARQALKKELPSPPEDQAA